VCSCPTEAGDGIQGVDLKYEARGLKDGSKQSRLDSVLERGG
jgi:hypothetical protein